MPDITSQLVPRTAAVEPFVDPITKAKGLWLTTAFQIFLRTLRQDLNQTARGVSPSPVIATDQNDSIAATDLITPVPVVNGLYIFQWSARVTIADGVSSSVQPVLSWTWGGVVQTKTFTAMTGDTVTTTASETYQFRADASAPITYAVTYASNTAAKMHYDFYAVLASVAGVP